jgi:hypothetical protein
MMLYEYEAWKREDSTTVGFDRDKFILEEWPEALESGEFEQSREGLRDEALDGSVSYCCLGVACTLLSRRGLLNRDDWIDRGTLPSKAVQLLGISERGRLNAPLTPLTLVQCNDELQENFRQIAAHLRAGQLQRESVS